MLVAARTRPMSTALGVLCALVFAVVVPHPCRAETGLPGASHAILVVPAPLPDTAWRHVTIPPQSTCRDCTACCPMIGRLRADTPGHRAAPAAASAPRAFPRGLPLAHHAAAMRATSSRATTMWATRFALTAATRQVLLQILLL